MLEPRDSPQMAEERQGRGRPRSAAGGRAGRMSGQRRPRTFSEDPWVVWPCCILPTLVFLGGGVVFLTAVWTEVFGGGFGEGMVYGLVVLGAIVGLLYAVHKRYNRP